MRISIIFSVFFISLSSLAWGADDVYHEPAATNAFGLKHFGDIVSVSASPPGVATSGKNTEPSGWTWVQKDFTHYTGTVHPVDGGTHSGIFAGTYTPTGNGGIIPGGVKQPDKKWDAKSSGLVLGVKITASPKNNRILVGAATPVTCKILNGADEAVHWSHIGVTSFVPNDDIKSINSVLTASIIPTVKEDVDKLMVNLVSDALVKDEKPLNITHPAHVEGSLKHGNLKETATVQNGFDKSAPIVMKAQFYYIITDQFKKHIDLSMATA